MRRFPVLFVAAVAALTVLPVATAFAADNPRGEQEGSCPAPEVTQAYDTGQFAVQAKLLASGCPARERSWFPLTLFISREDGRSGEGHGQVVMCGPFRSAVDSDADEAPATYECDAGISVDHPPMEAARYDVEVTYPGADGDETVNRAFTCLSAGTTASCSEETR